MEFNGSSPYPEGVISFLDTDLYKLTMQCAVLKYFPAVPVTYAFKNRTPEKKLSRRAFNWLQAQINKLGNICLSPDELRFLRTTCTYLDQAYLDYLQDFRLDPRNQVEATFTPVSPEGDKEGSHAGNDEDVLGDVVLNVKGLWVETILYEIPLLALTSEAYFRFMDRDWTYDDQEERAYDKGMHLLRTGCIVIEFGTRRRRDYHTQALVLRGLVRARKQAVKDGLPGTLSGTSNVHLAMRFGLAPLGTVAHEWYMGVAAITGNYETATTTALQYWIACFGVGVLGIALTDTFGTDVFLRSFAQPVPSFTTAVEGAAASTNDSLARTTPPPSDGNGTDSHTLHPSSPASQTFADAFTGVRQDSGDPAAFVQLMRDFYRSQTPPIDPASKTIVFSDSLNLELCAEYKRIAEAAGFRPTFGVGTFFTNDFVSTRTGRKSTPLNIVIKLSSAAGRPAVKLSDHAGKNTGDEDEVRRVKGVLGYVERSWEGGNEEERWGKEGDAEPKR